MSLKAEVAIIDTSFALDLGELEKSRILEEYIPRFIGVLYIHKYVYQNEILFPEKVKIQINRLITAGRAMIVDEDYISDNKPESVIIYQQIRKLLLDNLADTQVEQKNWGEVVSLAFAKAMGISIFLCSEKHLQEAVDEYLNLDEDDSISVDRVRVTSVKDFVGWMKEDNAPRKTAKLVWLRGGYSKEEFDQKFWPV